MKRYFYGLLAVAGITWLSCGPASETGKVSSMIPDTKEGLYKLGHQFYVDRNYDSADVYLMRSSSADPLYAAPANDLAQMHYMLGMQHPGERDPQRLEQFRKSLKYYALLESHGSGDADIYDRLSELSSALGDNKSLAKYARKNATLYPYDRQYVNLGFAYFEAGDFENVIKCQKEAIAKFKGSTYIGSFYRQLGRAYMKIDRDQTAERTFDSGLKAADEVIAERKKSNGKFASTDEYQRLMDDKIGMLVSLKSLHQLYRAADKLQAVERQLKELGYTK
jgi:tetratricopeptide (TPR) repeat protein